MADSKKSEPWRVAKVKFANGVVDPMTTSQPRTEFTDAKELRIEFDPSIRCIVLTHLRPGATEEAPRVPNPDRTPVIVPLENVLWMR